MRAEEVLASSIMRIVALDLADDNAANAIDTMEKTRAIEEYFKEKVKRQRADLITANHITDGRNRIMREIDWWLNEDLALREKFKFILKGIDPVIKATNDHSNLAVKVLIRPAMERVILDTMEGAPQAIESNFKVKLLDTVTRMSQELDGIDFSGEAMAEKAKLLDIINRALHELDGIDFPSKDTVDKYLRAATRLMTYDIADNNAQRTITSLDQTRAIEDYVESKVQQQKDYLLIANMIVADNMRTAREIGRAYDKLPKWLKEVGMTQGTFSKNKTIAELPDDKFEGWVAPWLTRENNFGEDRKELLFRYLVTYVRNLRKKGEL
jgi:hypothetical protein